MAYNNAAKKGGGFQKQGGAQQGSSNRPAYTLKVSVPTGEDTSELRNITGLFQNTKTAGILVTDEIVAALQGVKAGDRLVLFVNDL